MVFPKDREDDERRRREEQIQQRTVTYKVCSKHNRRFPEGDRCPLCEAEDRNTQRKASPSARG
jgi:hypothetical protein